MSTTEQDTNIIETITGFLSRYMHFRDDDQKLIIALWVLHTHLFDPNIGTTPWVTPYIYLNSPEPGCGKTLLLDLLEMLIHSPLKSGDMTSSAMFRVIEDRRPTIMFDEVDTIWNGAKNDDLRRTLNTGYKHGGSTVRTSAGEIVEFSTFAPKILAGIRDDAAELPATVRTRSIQITLAKKPADVTIERFRNFKVISLAEPIKEIIEAWVSAKAVAINETDPEDGDLDNRELEISYPLLQVAMIAGVEAEAREALARLFIPEAPKDTAEVAALRKIRDLFASEETDRLHSATICAALGEGWNGKLLGMRVTGPMKVGSPTTLPYKGKQAKGYYIWQFEAAFKKHLS